MKKQLTQEQRVNILEKVMKVRSQDKTRGDRLLEAMTRVLYSKK